MIAQNLHRLKVEKSSQHLTSFAGLPLLTELAHNIGLIKRLDAIPSVWQRQSQYHTSNYVMGLAMTLIAGGEGLDDVRILRADPGLSQVALPTLPASNSVGQFLRRFDQRALYHLANVIADLAVRIIKPQQALTLDIDSTLIEAHKDSAKMSY